MASSSSASSSESAGGVLAWASRRNPSSAANWSEVIWLAASRLSASYIDTDVVPSASTARVAAEAGLFSSCASPAASVPSATRASRSRTVASTRRTVPTYPRMKWTPNANHSSARSRSRSAVSVYMRPSVAPNPVAR